MADPFDQLTALISPLLPAGERATLAQVAQTLRNPPDGAAWHAAVGAYRGFVQRTAKDLVPRPIRAVPGVDALIDSWVGQLLTMAEGELADFASELDLGPAGAALTLPPVYLPNPLGGRPTMLGLLPPSGLALHLGAGPASGGGAIDYASTPNQRLSGSLGIKMGVMGLAALAMLEEAPGGYALTALLAARFAPGIQIGFGFAITGVGGLIGVNRAVEVSALEARFRSGALADALFGDDPIRNAASALQTLNEVFVARAGSHVFGPTFQIAWLKIGAIAFFNVDLGLFAQLPGPSRIDILASARAEIPLVFRLRLDVHGEIDLPQQLIGVHAVIVDSHVMSIFRMSGEAIFRMHYGDQPYVVLTIGGFFPGFNPAPAALPPNIQRIGLALDLPIDLPLYFRAEAYFAVTTNTIQFGGRLEAGIDVSLFSATGHLQLDAIFQFSPFAFQADFSAGFEIRVLGESFSGVNVSGTISGPGPFVIHAQIEYEMPFFLPDISWSDTFVLGDPAPKDAPIADLLSLLRPELASGGNLRAENADDRFVAVAAGAAAGGLALLAPRGSLVWSQKRAPLGLPLQRFEGAELAREWLLDAATGELIGAPPSERFSPGMFRRLSDAEKTNLPAFEPHAAGLRFSFGMAAPAPTPHKVAYMVEYRPNRRGLGGPMLRYRAALLAKVQNLHAAPTVANRAPVVALKPETWSVRAQSFDTQIAAHLAAQRSSGVAHLAGDLINLGGI